ncbi:MAG TPA: metallophosphoesterase [Candidatus Limnocylindrales bacterium]
MARVILIGDVGGHVDALRAALISAGAFPRVPGGTTVIQVGDLVDRGPDSEAVVELVHTYLNEQPDRWIQLAGNHDAQYLPQGWSFYRASLGGTHISLLRSLKLSVAAAVATPEGEYLVTHAGLTAGLWRELGEPMTAATAAMLLNERPDLMWHMSGPLWADAGSEVYEPWLDFRDYVPFGQIHGHSTIVHFEKREFYCSGKVRQRASVDWHARHTRVRIGGRQFIGIDPKLGRDGTAQWAPLILDGEVFR